MKASTVANLHELVNFYFNFGLTHEEILMLLHIVGEIIIIMHILWGILNKMALYRRTKQFDLLDVVTFLTDQLESMVSIGNTTKGQPYI